MALSKESLQKTPKEVKDALEAAQLAAMKAQSKAYALEEAAKDSAADQKKLYALALKGGR